MKCHYCHEEFTPTSRDYQYTAGWAQTRRRKGGTNAISNPTRYDRWAHNSCVKLPGQKTLLLEEVERLYDPTNYK